jgi:hypothetical protein
LKTLAKIKMVVASDSRCRFPVSGGFRKPDMERYARAGVRDKPSVSGNLQKPET